MSLSLFKELKKAWQNEKIKRSNVKNRVAYTAIKHNV